MVGDIFIANIYFTDSSSFKARPVLLLKTNSFNDVLFLPLTSNTGTKGIAIDNTNLKEGYLPKTSVVVYEKPGVIAHTLLIKKIAALKDEVYNEVIENLVSFLK